MRQATEVFAPQLEQLHSIPGIQAITARDIIAEIGAERRRCGSATRLSSWAGVSPGNNESAGKRRRDAPARAIDICVGSWCSVPGRHGRRQRVFGRTLRRLDSRLGRKKAAMAVAHNILVSISHVRMDGTFYEESRYDRHDAREEERDKKRAIAALERLGYEVALSPVTLTAQTAPFRTAGRAAHRRGTAGGNLADRSLRNGDRAGPSPPSGVGARDPLPPSCRFRKWQHVQRRRHQRGPLFPREHARRPAAPPFHGQTG